MRWLAHIMVFLLACAALVNSFLVQVEVRSGAEVKKETTQQLSVGSVDIYKTTPDVFPPHVRKTANMPRVMNSADCPVGLCQDV